LFKPKRVFFERQALDYPSGKKLYDYFTNQNVELLTLNSHNRVTGIPGSTPQEAYLEGKKTLVVGVRKTLNFASCKPSAHYQLPLVTSCMGKCQYCYLNTQLGKKPYIRIYVNIEEILKKTAKLIKERQPEVTVFEGAATSDPIPVEPFTGSLAETINYFANQPLGRFRFVTKFTDVDSLLNIKHGGHTTVRFSINSPPIIKTFEQGTPRLSARVKAAKKMDEAGYPLGFIIAPVFIYKDWEKDYHDMLKDLAKALNLDPNKPPRFEIISHRYTLRAKSTILDIFPDTKIPMKEEDRQFKYGQFGYGKYVYPKEKREQIKGFFTKEISELFPDAPIDYII